MVSRYISNCSLLLLPLFLLSGCAFLHHVQVGEVDARKDMVGIPFDIKVSEVGVSVEEAGRIARAADSKAGSDAAAIIGLFQMGPRTGNPVYDEHYADKIIYQIYEKCPNGKITNLMSIRETRKYPVISGEIVKITGICMKQRTTASAVENLE